MFSLAVGLVLALLWFLLPFLLRKWGEVRLDKCCRAGRVIVLSYDDGPGPSLTPSLLNLLAEYGARATFHVLGRNARLSPDLMQRLIADGHEVGSHTQDHSNAWKTGPFRFARDLAAGVRTVDALGGQGRHFRPPFGKMTLAGLAQGLALGLRYSWWTVDSRDSWARRPIAEVLAELIRRGGGVVLMHDFDTYARAPAPPAHPEHVLALTRSILDMARREGFRILPLSAL